MIPTNTNLVTGANDQEFSASLDLTGQRILLELRVFNGPAEGRPVTLSSDPTSGDRIEIILIDREKPETVFAIRFEDYKHSHPIDLIDFATESLVEGADR